MTWDRLLAAGAAPTARRVIVLQPALDFSRMQPAADAIADVRAIAARLNASRDAPVTVRLTGSVAMEHEELLSVSRGAGLGALATLALVSLVLYAALRSWRLLAVSLVTLVVGLALTAAFAAANGRPTQSSIRRVRRAERWLGQRLRDPRAAALPRARRGRPGDYTGSRRHGARRRLVARAVRRDDRGRFLLLYTDDVLGRLRARVDRRHRRVLRVVRQRDAVARARCVVGRCAARPEIAATWLDPRIFAPLSRRPRLVLGATAVVLVAAFAALPRVSFDSNPIHLRDPGSESVTTLLELAAAGEAPLLNLVAVAPDAAIARGWAESLRRLPTVRGVTTTDQLVPAEQGEKLALIEDLALLLGPGFAELERVPPDPAALSAALAALEAASACSAGRAALCTMPLSACAARLAPMTEAERDATLRALDSALTSGLPRELARLETALTAAGFERGDLPAGARRRVGSRATDASSSRSRRPKTSATTRPRGGSLLRCTRWCPRRPDCPSSIKKRRQPSSRRSSERCSMPSSWCP